MQDETRCRTNRLLIAAAVAALAVIGLVFLLTPAHVAAAPRPPGQPGGHVAELVCQLFTLCG